MLNLNFDEYLKSSQAATIADIQTEVDKTEKGSFDDGYWRLETDKSGNGFAEIRVLPTPPGEKSPFIMYFSHYFKGPTGKVYNERSRTTLAGEKDPVGESNNKLWNSGYESDKEVARSRSRKKNYVINVLILKDPAKPENEGKIKKYRFGKKIWEKFAAAMKPAFEGDEPINPFSLMGDGANFRLRAKKVAGYPNYDDSTFTGKTALFGGDIDKMRAVLEGQTLPSLEELMDGKHFKAYDDLNKRFREVLDESSEVTSRASDMASEPKREERKTVVAQTRETIEKEAAPVKEAEVAPSADEDEDDLSYFRKLAGKK
jgi:hypothetical protein